MTEAVVGSQHVRHEIIMDADPPPYVDIARPLKLESSDCSSVRLKYSGQVCQLIADVNTISPKLVELAIYSAWFPFSPDIPFFSYDLTVTLPPKCVVATNGTQVRRSATALNPRFRFGGPWDRARI